MNVFPFFSFLFFGFQISYSLKYQWTDASDPFTFNFLLVKLSLSEKTNHIPKEMIIPKQTLRFEEVKTAVSNKFTKFLVKKLYIYMWQISL